ncbi:DC-STAMP-like protein [Mactra antiquata]
MAVKEVIRAIKIKMMLNRLSKAKENALRELIGLPPKMSWYDECSSTLTSCIKDKFCQTFTPCCMYDVNRHLKRPSCWTSPTFREFLGFIGGIIMTLLMDIPAEIACTGCIIAGFILTLTMAFSDNIRCLVLLMLPQFFSGKGRMLLLIYALFLAMNHPLNNVRSNINVMSQSATCGQEMALNGTKELVKAAMAPMQSIMDSVKEVLSKLVDFANMMKKTYNVLKQTVSEIGSTIRRVGQWLASMVDRCNDTMGKPYRKCQAAFDRAVQNCKDDLGILGGICEIAGGFDVLCNIVRVGELLCLIVDAIKNLIESAVDLPTQRVLSSAQEMFYFNVTIDYHFNFTMKQSKSYTKIKDEISMKILSDLDGVLILVRILRNLMFITAFFIIIKTRWLSEDRYDNIYITFIVRDLDERRKQNNKPGILPLNYDEENKYIDSLSGRMIPRELKKLAFGLVIYIVSMFNAAFYLLCDVGLYAALRLIETNFGVLSQPPVPAHTKMHIDGNGPMSDMYKSVIGMFDPLTDTTKSKVDVAPCVPHPTKPDWGVYRVIGAIYVLCLILTIGEAYGLRLRHVIMACYFQKRERARAIWLFNHILKTRGGILENARETMKKNKMGQVDTQHISLKGRLAASYPICDKILRCFGWERKSCLYCGREGKPDDYFHFIHCAFYDCDAIYCIECYADLDNICAVCDNNVEIIGSENSEEIDSSLDEQQKLIHRVQKLRRDERVSELQAQRRPSKVLARMREQFNPPGRDGVVTMATGEEMTDIDDERNNNADDEYEKTRPKKTVSKCGHISLNVGTKRYDLKQSRNEEKRYTVYSLDGMLSLNQTKQRHSSSSSSSSSSGEDEIMSESSLDTNILDFDYQDNIGDIDSSIDEVQNVDANIRRKNVDFVTEDIFTDSDDSYNEFEINENRNILTDEYVEEPLMFSMRRT